MTTFNAPARSFSDAIEENSIALCLGLMTLITFANVIARYVFNSNILWALEMTKFLFAWLVLMGASYGVKKQFHIGVDVVINMLSPARRRLCAMLAAACCLVFALLLLIGAWQYWYPFITDQAWYETEDIPMPGVMQFMADWLNDGEKYEKIPRFIPYLALPLGMALLTYRFIEVGWKVWKGEVDTLIANHEAEETADKMMNKAEVVIKGGK